MDLQASAVGVVAHAHVRRLLASVTTDHFWRRDRTGIEPVALPARTDSSSCLSSVRVGPPSVPMISSTPSRLDHGVGGLSVHMYDSAQTPQSTRRILSWARMMWAG
jgi:hypothetical protein